MDIYFYQAECGDAARIRYVGNDGKPHNILIDSGYERTFDHVLADEIQKVRQAGERIDLWVVSHIHDDHIGGALEYKNTIIYGGQEDIVDNWYYNPPRSTAKELVEVQSDLISSAKSIKQGDGLTEFLVASGKLPKADITSELPPLDLHGLKMTILTPASNELNRLREKYPVTDLRMLEREELDVVSEAKAAKGNDYHIQIGDFDLDHWSEDNSVENGSSISILTEFNGKRTLWLADSHPTDIAISLKALGYTNSAPIVCDYVKVSHHGSKGNNSDNLYNLIRCNHYIMSVDGENKHNLPNKECIARILRNQNRPSESHYHFYFTYDNQTLRNIFEKDGEDVYEKWNFTNHFVSDKKWVEINY
ncbi:MBL fold metallo-hydrolase [Pontibacter sp. 13R65]|uniref:MBL fold metallo-hydrolase n=1 Tax=Pontibacter sp. 13R65 TaxID=3127458 RepID=UPI00301BB7FC